MTIQLVDHPTQELMNFFEEQIDKFNLQRWEVKEKVPLVLKVENAQGDIIAGVSAKTFGYWLLIENLWVSEELRKQNMGSKILLRLHEVALQRGCRFALLDTLNFQARGFYEKFGYRVQWTQEEYPKIGSKFFMTKTL